MRVAAAAVSLARRRPLLAAVTVGFLLRLAALVAVSAYLKRAGRPFLIDGDAWTYLQLAGDLGQGDPYRYDAPGSPRLAMRPPGFPLLLGGVLWVTRTFLSVWGGTESLPFLRPVIVLCGTAAVWATGRLGTAIAGPRVGAAAAWLAAVNPLAVAFSVMLLSESLFALLATLSLWGVAECVRPDDARAKPSPRWMPAVWGGLAAAGATLTRSVWLPMPFAVAALAVVLAARGASRGNHGAGTPSPSARASGCQDWRWAGVFLLAFGAGYAPWPLRNFAVLGEPVLTTTWAGPTLYDSLGPQATGASDMRFFERDERVINLELGPEPTIYVPPGERAEYVRRMREIRPVVQATWPPQPAGPGDLTEEEAAAIWAAIGEDDAAWFQARGLDIEHGFSELGVDRNYRRSALDAAFADPLRVARLAVVKQGRFWRPWPIGGLPGGVAGGVLKAGFAAYFVPLIALAVWGAWRLWQPEARAEGIGGDPGGIPRLPPRAAMGRGWAWVLTWGPALGFAGVCLVFVGSVRYRLPGEFPLAVAAAVGGLDLWDRRASAGRTPTDRTAD